MKLMTTETTGNAIVSANSNNINYPVSNLLDSRLTRIYKSDDSTSVTITFDLGSAKTIDNISIANHNISSGVTVLKWQGNASNTWSSPSIDETLTWSSGIINKSFTGGSYRYWRLEIVDSGNTDGFISIGRVYGSEAEISPGIAPLFSHTRKSESKKSISVAGNIYGDKRYFYDMISIRWKKISHSQKAEIIEWFEAVDITDPFFITFNEDCLDMVTYYVVMDVDQISFNLLANPAYYEAAASFREAK